MLTGFCKPLLGFAFAIALAAPIELFAQPQFANPGLGDSSRSVAKPQRVRQKVLVWQDPANSVGAYCIAGEVSQPGTYTKTGPISLQQLVMAAGGLLENAGPTVRLIRNGRDGQRYFFRPDGSDQLLPGDVIVFDENRRLDQQNGQQRTARGDDFGVQLILVGVTPFPAVVRVNREEANLGDVVTLLKQDPEVARSVRVMGPNPASGSRTGWQVLPSGTVLVFDSRAIQHGLLPTFIPPKSLDEFSGNPISRTSGVASPISAAMGASPMPTHQQSSAVQAERFRRSTIAMAGNDDGAEIGVGNPVTDAPEPPAIDYNPAPAPGSRSAVPQMSSGVSATRIPFGAGTWRSQQAAQADGNFNRPNTANLRRSAGPIAVIEEPLTDSAPTEVEADRVAKGMNSEANSVAQSQPALSGLQMMGIFAGVLVLVAAGALIGRLPEQTKASFSGWSTSTPEVAKSESTSPAEVSSMNRESQARLVAEQMAPPAKMAEQPLDLERLIGNSMPISEEAVSFPPQMMFQGVPVQQHMLRVDAGQPAGEASSVRSPHFMPAADEAQRPSREMAGAERASSPAIERALRQLREGRRA